jgi:hypothetical protein
MALPSDDKILDHNSKEFDAVFDEATKVARKKRLNPNKSMGATYDGYCKAVDRVGDDLAGAAKRTLKDFGWI